jgi:hypothetical protein
MAKSSRFLDTISFPTHYGRDTLLKLSYGGLDAKQTVQELFEMLAAADEVNLRVLVACTDERVLYQGLHPQSPMYVGDELALRTAGAIIFHTQSVLEARSLDLVVGLARYHVDSAA